VRKVKSLVKVLALAPHHRLHREHVIDRWWPDMGSEDEANNLHKVFYIPLCRALAAEARHPLQCWERMHLQIARKYTPGGSLGVSLLTTQIEGGAE
jgi:DNA-binding SARP family transcriptional activator